MNTTLLQVVKLSKGGRFAANQSYFEKDSAYYMYIDGSQIHITQALAKNATLSVNTRYGNAQKKYNYSMKISNNFCEQLQLVGGASYVAIREALDGFIVTKATEDEIRKYGTKTHRAPISGEVRSGNVIYFTPEQKKFLGIGASGQFKLQMRSKSCLVLSPLSENEAKRLPPLKKVYKKQRYTCKVQYPMAFKIPEQFIRNCNIKPGDILPMYFKENSIYLEGIPHKCSFCGKEDRNAVSVAICEDCASTLPTIQRIIQENGGNALAAARVALATLKTALKEVE